MSAGFWSTHGVHLASTLGPMAVIAVAATGADVVNRARIKATPPLVLAALLSVAAATVHGVVCPQHFSEGLLYGLFFGALALAQLGWAAAVLLRPDRRLLVLGVAANLAVLALWALTRTVGIPLGPESGVIEPVGALDLVAGFAEVGVIACAGWALSGRRVHVASRATA